MNSALQSRCGGRAAFHGEAPPGAAARGAAGEDQGDAPPGGVGWVGELGQGELAGACVCASGQGEAAAGFEGWEGESGHGDCAPARPAGTSSSAASERARAPIIVSSQNRNGNRPFDKRAGRR
jgi:hypothetical protein